MIFQNTEETVRTLITDPIVMIASDGSMENGKGHPRSAGTFARVLGKYVREEKALSLMDAIRKSAPCRRNGWSRCPRKCARKAASKSVLTPTSLYSTRRGLSTRLRLKTPRNTPKVFATS